MARWRARQDPEEKYEVRESEKYEVAKTSQKLVINKGEQWLTQMRQHGVKYTGQISLGNHSSLAKGYIKCGFQPPAEWLLEASLAAVKTLQIK